MKIEDVDMIFQILKKQIEESNNGLDHKDDCISLYQLMRLTKYNYSKNLNKAYDYFNKIEDKMNASSVRINLDPKDKNKLNLRVMRSSGQYVDVDFQIYEDDLIIDKSKGDNPENFIQKVGNLLFSYYKNILVNDEVICKYNIIDGFIKVSCTIDYYDISKSKIVIEILNNEWTNEVDDKPLCSISFDLSPDSDYAKDYSINCDSLKVVNFIEENINLLTYSISFSKEKCPKILLDMYNVEKEEKKAELRRLEVSANENTKKEAGNQLIKMIFNNLRRKS